MRKNKQRTALHTFFILSLIFLVAFVVLNIVYFVAINEMQFGDYFKELFDDIGGLYVYPFNKEAESAYYLVAVYSSLDVNPLVISILALAFSGAIFILMVIGLIRVLAKKRAGYLFYGLALLVLILVGDIVLLYTPAFLSVVKAYSQGNADAMSAALIAILILVFAALALVTTLVTYFIGLSYAGKRNAPVNNDVVAFETEQPVLAEETLAVAASEPVEEPVAEVAQEYIPVVEPEPEPDPVPEEEIVEPVEEMVEPEPIPEPQPDETNNHVEVNVNNSMPSPNPAPGIDPNSLASLLREVVRDIVRDEIARNNANQPRPEESRGNGNQTITGATFGGPLVVQYFNGGINGVTPATPAPAPEPVKEEPAPAPVKEEPVPEPVKEEPVVEEPVKEEPAPVVEVVAPAPVPFVPVNKPENENKVEYERLTFAERLLQSDKELLDLYNELKNEILSYGVKSRISANGDTFRLHKKMYVRITVAGKSLKLYFALNPDDYRDSKIPVQDAGHKDLYAEIPLVFKVRSGLSVRRAKELIQDTMDKDGLEQGEIGKVNWAKELKAELKEKKSSKDED